MRWQGQSVPSRKNTTTALIAFAAFLSYACGGCLSNEYVIPKTELARLASLSGQQRGESVHVVQQVGERRSDAIDTSQPAGPSPYAQEGYAQGGPTVEGEPNLGVGVAVGIALAPAPLPPPGPPLPGHVGRPLPRGPVAGTPPRPAPPPRKSTGHGGSLGNGGGGGGKDDLVALLVVFAVLATVGMVATEGARYDGTVAMVPWQGVHLKDAAGQEREVPLAQLTPADVASTSEARVMDDEGWGMMRIARGPLDRRGFAWKMDLGLLHSSCGCLVADGVAADIQLGYFPHSRFGILADWSPGGGSDANGKSFYRHNLGLEAQFFPVTLSRLHLGGFAHGGMVYANDDAGGTRNGPALGGGAILEVSLTARLALTVRFDYTSAKTAPGGAGWQGAESFTAGVAIY